MKRLLLITLMVLMASGCNLLKKANHEQGSEPLTPPPATSFNLPIILGYHPVSYEGWVPQDQQLLVEANQPYMAVWIYQGAWNRYPIPSSIVSYDASTGMVKFSGCAGCYYHFFQWMPGA